jgi:hypothetical protein
LFFSGCLDFMAHLPWWIQLGSARSATLTQSLHRGRAAVLFQNHAATIYTIASTGAMLLYRAGNAPETIMRP